MGDEVARQITGEVGAGPLASRWKGPVMALGLAILLSLAIWMILSQVGGGLSQQREDGDVTSFQEETGIRVLRVALTAAGGLVDLQYQVVDPDKSLIVHDDDNPPTLRDADSGLVLATPFHDHAARELHTAVTYHQLIRNGGGLLKRGSKVIIKVGTSHLANFIVQ
jgi:hypothetical protein